MHFRVEADISKHLSVTDKCRCSHFKVAATPALRISLLCSEKTRSLESGTIQSSSAWAAVRYVLVGLNLKLDIIQKTRAYSA